MMRDDQRTDRNRFSRRSPSWIGVNVLFLAFLAACLIGSRDEVGGLGVVALLFVDSALIGRTVCSGLFLSGESWAKRGVFSTKRFPKECVVDLSGAPYSGIWNWGGSSRFFGMIRILLDSGEVVEVPELAGTHKRISGLLRELRVVQNLEPDLNVKSHAGDRINSTDSL